VAGVAGARRGEGLQRRGVGAYRGGGRVTRAARATAPVAPAVRRTALGRARLAGPVRAAVFAGRRGRSVGALTAAAAGTGSGVSRKDARAGARGCGRSVARPARTAAAVVSTLEAAAVRGAALTRAVQAAMRTRRRRRRVGALAAAAVAGRGVGRERSRARAGGCRRGVTGTAVPATAVAPALGAAAVRRAALAGTAGTAFGAGEAARRVGALPGHTAARVRVGRQHRSRRAGRRRGRIAGATRAPAPVVTTLGVAAVRLASRRIGLPSGIRPDPCVASVFP